MTRHEHRGAYAGIAALFGVPLVVALLVVTAAAMGQPAAELDLEQALVERLTVWTRPDGARVYVRHCRGVSAGCEARIRAFAVLLEGAAGRHGLDPFVLASIAVRESGLDPSAVGAVGEAGIVQLHPRGAGRRVAFVQSAAFRDRCVRRPDACQAAVVELGAGLLAKSIARCGSLEAGLGMYNAGECDPGRPYVRRVLAELERLRRLGSVGEQSPPGAS